MDEKSSLKRLLFIISCYILLFLILSSFGFIGYHSFCKTNVSENYVFSRATAVTNREIVISNRNFSVRYEYPTNTIPYSGGTNIHIKIRDASVIVYEIVGTNISKINGTMDGVIPMTGGLDEEADRYYVFKAFGTNWI